MFYFNSSLIWLNGLKISVYIDAWCIIQLRNYMFSIFCQISLSLSLSLCFCEFVLEHSITCLCLLAKAKLFFTIKHRPTCLTWLHACQICSNCEMWILDPRLVHSWRNSQVIDPRRCGRRLPVRYVVVLNSENVEIIYFYFCRVLWLFVNRRWTWYNFSFGLGWILFNPKRKWYGAEIFKVSRSHLEAIVIN